MPKSSSNKAVEEPAGDVAVDAAAESSGHDADTVADNVESEPIQVEQKVESEPEVEQKYEVYTTLEPERPYIMTKHEVDECERDGILKSSSPVKE